MRGRIGTASARARTRSQTRSLSASTKTCISTTGDSAVTKWCQRSCNEPTPNCPKSRCACGSIPPSTQPDKTCRSTAGDSARTRWCQLSCNSPTPNCPKSLCTCTATTPAPSPKPSPKPTPPPTSNPGKGGQRIVTVTGTDATFQELMAQKKLWRVYSPLACPCTSLHPHFDW